MPKTFEEIWFYDEQLTDLEQISEDTGASPHDLVRMAVTAFVNIYEKEQKQ